MMGKKHSEEAKEKMRQKKLGKYVGEKNPFFGKKHSDEAKKKMRKRKMENPTMYWKGKKRSKETIEKMRLASWKGDDIGYVQRHQRIRWLLGTPNICETCNRTDRKKYEWSNKDHKYTLDPQDWQRLCVSCHQKYDIEHNNYKKHSLESNKKVSESMKKVWERRKSV